MDEKKEPAIYILNSKEKTVKHILRSVWESVQERENLWINGILV